MIHRITGTIASRTVKIDDRLLDPRTSLKIINHSPDGFNWGYGGSGPAQLALAILLDTGDKEAAIRHHQDFKWSVISRLPQGKDFDISVDVDLWIEQAEEGVSPLLY